jgi:phage protein U
MSLLSWGDFHFQIDTFAHNTLMRTWEANIASHGIVKSNARVQATGIPVETITIRGAIYTKFSKKADSFPQELRRLGNEMEPRELFLGTGDLLGSWFLKSIQEEQSALMKDGIPRKQALTLQFTKYNRKADPRQNEPITTNQN